MSSPESFIDEVTEEVRRDRLFAFFRRYGWIAVLVVVLIVGGAAWNEWQKARATDAARAFGDAVLAAQSSVDPATRIKALSAIPSEGARSAIAHFLAASDAVAAHDTKTALSELDLIANDAAMPASFRSLATLKRVMVAGDDMPADARKSALEGLAAAGQPFRPLAMEQLAYLTLKAGDKAGAITQFKAILQEPQLTQGLRQRASQMIVALGGDAKGS